MYMGESPAEGLREIAVVLNTASGKGDAETLAQELTREFNTLGVDPHLLYVSSEEGPEALARQAVGLKADRVLLCGGDGTVSGGLAGLVDSGISAALLPAGTGNLLAHNLGVLGTVPELVQIAVHGRPQPLDLIRIETDQGQVFWSSVMSGVGFDAKIVEGTDRKAKKLWGPLAYIVSAVRNYRPGSFLMWMEIDGGKVIRTRASSITIANAGTLQGGIPLLPDAKMDDGLVDIAVVHASALPEWLRVVWNILLRRVHQEPTVDLYQCRTARLYFRRRQNFQYDGESVGQVHRLSIEVYPAAVSVMVPKENATMPAEQG